MKTERFEEEDSPGWLLTFADLMTLLMVFFVLLFSMSKIEKDKFVDVINALQVEFLGEKMANSLIHLDVIAPVTTELPQPDDVTVKETSVNRSNNDVGKQTGDKTADKKTAAPVQTTDLKDWDIVLKQVEQSIIEEGLTSDAVVSMPRDGQIKITVDGSLFFEPGSIHVSSRANQFVNLVLDIMYDHNDYRVDILGHTDNSPIDTDRFPTNWELSALRATSVLRYMVRGGAEPERLRAIGYGETQPVTSNTTAKNRAKNRRIEFILEKPREN